MKKIAVIFMILCVFCLSFAAAEPVSYVSEGTPLEMGDFTLNLEEGTLAEIYDKVENQTYITVYPLIDGEPTEINYEIMCFDATKSDFDTFVEINKASVENAGLTIQDYSVDPESYICEIGGKKCLTRKISVSFLVPGSDSVMQNDLACIVSPGEPYLIVIYSAPSVPVDYIVPIVNRQLVWNN